MAYYTAATTCAFAVETCVRAGGKEERRLWLFTFLVLRELLIIGQLLGNCVCLQELAP